MKIHTKKFGQDFRDEQKRQQRDDMDEYFDSLQDKGEVVESRLLTKIERMQMQYPIYWNGARFTIVIE